MGLHSRGLIIGRIFAFKIWGLSFGGRGVLLQRTVIGDTLTEVQEPEHKSFSSFNIESEQLVAVCAKGKAFMLNACQPLGVQGGEGLEGGVGSTPSPVIFVQQRKGDFCGGEPVTESGTPVMTILLL